MRTQDEIVSYYKGTQKRDFFGFTAGVMLPYLDFDRAKPFLKDNAEREKWGGGEALTEDGVIELMRDYMGFAWGKAKDHRGLSAERSVEKLTAWLWLLADDELYAFANVDINYKNYGAPILKAICDEYDFDIPASDALMNMAQGKSCEQDCYEGCG